MQDYGEILTMDNFMSREECQTATQQIDALIDNGFALEVNRQPHRQDDCLHLHVVGAEGAAIARTFIQKLYDIAIPEYISRFPTLGNTQLGVLDCKAQRTQAGGGFHGWHHEAIDGLTNDRILAYTLYLNDNFEGGETEFLYQNLRVNAVAGRCSLFPTGFLHTHRGNPPIGGTKYILTGWIINADPYAVMRG